MFTTPTATFAKITAFARWFDANIGTEYEMDGEMDSHTITCFELEGDEYNQCKAWWASH